MNSNFLNKNKFPALLLIVLVGLAIYSNTFEVPFTWDDYTTITQNSSIHSLESFLDNGHKYNLANPNRYIGYLTFAVNYHFGEERVFGYHLVNLVIHLCSALLVYALIRLTLSTPVMRDSRLRRLAGWVALLTALVFVAHPVQTQAVTYINQRVTSLATLFYLLSVVFYAKARLGAVFHFRQHDKSKDKHPGRDRLTEPHKAHTIVRRTYARAIPVLYLVGSFSAALLAMNTKEIAVTLPLAIVLYEVAFFKEKWKRRFFFLLPLLATLPILPMTVINFEELSSVVQTDVAAYFDSNSQKNVEQVEPVAKIPPNPDVSSEAAIKQSEESDGLLRADTVMPRHVYLLTQFRVIVTYLRLLILPVNQNIDYDYPFYEVITTPPVFLSFVFLLLILTSTVFLFWRARPAHLHDMDGGLPMRSSLKRRFLSLNVDPAFRLIAFGIFWFFLTLSLESSIIPIADVIMEHRLYLPSFGVFTAFATGCFLLCGNRNWIFSGRLLSVGAVSLIIVLAIASYQRNHVWGDNLRLWQDAADKSPNKARPHHTVGVLLAQDARNSEAIQAFSRAIAVDPFYHQSYYRLADLYLVEGNPEMAINLIRVYLELKPDSIEGHVMYGAALIKGGRFREAESFLELNIDRLNTNAEAHFYLGAAYAFLGKSTAAKRQLEIVARDNPRLAASLRSLLNMKSMHGFSHGQN